MVKIEDKSELLAFRTGVVLGASCLFALGTALGVHLGIGNINTLQDGLYRKKSCYEFTTQLADTGNVVVEGKPGGFDAEGFSLYCNPASIFVKSGSDQSRLSGRMDLAIDEMRRKVPYDADFSVKVYGRGDGKGGLEAKFIDINGDLYPVYR